MMKFNRTEENKWYVSRLESIKKTTKREGRAYKQQYNYYLPLIQKEKKKSWQKFVQNFQGQEIFQLVK